MFVVQMNDLEGVLRESQDDQEMQCMAEEEQQQLQQQVCQLNQHCIKAAQNVVVTTCQLHACGLSARRKFSSCCTQAYVTACKGALGRLIL